MTSDVITVLLDEKGQANIPYGYENKGLVTDDTGKTYILAVKSDMSNISQQEAINQYNTTGQTTPTTTTNTPSLTFGYTQYVKQQVEQNPEEFKQIVGPEKQPSLWLGGTTEYLKQNPPNFVTTQDRESSNTSTTQEQDDFTRALIPTPEPTPNNLMLPDVTDVAAGSVYTITKWLTGSRTSAQAMYDLTQGIGLTIGTTRKEFTPEGYIINYLPSPDNQDAFMAGRIVGIPISMGITENVGSFFADYAIQPIEAQTIQISEGAYTISSTAVRTGGGEIITKSFQRLLSSEGNKFVYTSAISDLTKSGRSITIGYSNPPSLTTYSYTKGSVSEGLLTTKSGEWLDFASGTLTNRGYRYPVSIISTSANNLRGVSSISGTLPIISGSPTLSASKISGLTSGVQSISEAISSTKVGSNLISSLKFMAGLGSAAKISPIRTSTISMPTTKLYTPSATLSPTISRSRISSIPQQTFKPPTTKSISTTKTISIPVTKPVTIPITKTSAPSMPRSIPSGIRVPIRLPSVDLKFGGRTKMSGFKSASFARKYSYSPSLSALVFNVKKFGSIPKKLTGLEVRPIVLGRKRKKSRTIKRRKKRK